MLEEIKKNINIDKRNFILVKNLPVKLGKFDILDDNIIFYVFPEYAKNARNKRKRKYEFKFNGIIGNDSISADTIEKYDINKPVYYILDGVDFEDDEVNIECKGDVILVISNCTFSRQLTIKNANSVMLSHNKYYDSFENNYDLKGRFIRTEGRINKFILRNENLVNLSKNSGTNFGANINAENIVIKDSIIKGSDDSVLITHANSTEIIRSSIEMPEVYIYSNKYVEDEAAVNADKGFIYANETWIDFEMSNLKTEVENEMKKIK